MELVPIIQQILTIAAILAIVTLLVSYTAFKVRQKKRPEQVYEKNQIEHMEPSFIGKSIRRITRITKEIVPLTPPAQIKNVKKKPKISEESLPPGRHQRVIEKPNESSKEYSKHKRLEVLKNFQDQNNETGNNSDERKRNENTLNSIGDDILSKYSDNKDQSLFTLKANKKEN